MVKKLTELCFLAREMNFNYRLTNKFIRRYFSQKKAREGGPGSGNWGHKGRLGKVGGSAPGGGVSAWLELKTFIPEAAGPVKDFWERRYPELSLPDFMTNAYEMTSSSGLSTVIDLVGYYKESIEVEGTIYDEDQNVAGFFQRRIKPDGVVEHELFEVYQQHQGKGFGSEFYGNSEKAYVRAGMKRIELNADLDVGGYAWAKMGFDFASQYYRDKINSRFKDAYRDRYGEVGPSFEHAWDMAAAVGPDGYRIGKEAMLGSDWDGVKRLDPSDRGFQVGLDYIASKQ